ncbi:HNH endonuclease signature motif containing protein [Shewanella frigidimarina]|uniref:HNH endonuclease n=1 Tax=Shewanella frigidimarina TaxID=56812 RepID=UPI0031712DCE
MSYWWVNHKQTYTNEVEGGYIWSPKENSNGAKNQTYINLTLTMPGDIVFSYAGGKIKAVGVVSSHYREQPKPSEFGKIGDSWANVGWVVPIDWEILLTPVIPKEHIEIIEPLLPRKYSPLQRNGNGNQSCYLASIQDELGLFLIGLAKPKNVDAISSDEDEIGEIEELKIIDEINNSNIESTEKKQLIRARKGQGKFRLNVQEIEIRCRVTGVIAKNMLIASHIKPWKVSNNFERLDGNNGLLLSPHIDKLFDQGWISFTDNGDLICESDEIFKILGQWNICLPMNVGMFTQKQAEYLSYHRENVYKG